MALEKGRRLGPYEITEPAGAGGMGEVYKAKDTRLDRTVAIKILPQKMVITGDTRARFEREAKTISSLNHPNICILHDIGHENGIDYLVMEYMEGETLSSRIKKGRLEISEVLNIGAQIAGALDGAHRKGLVHRDLKPSNIFLTKDGVKVFDFGLAKLRADAAGVGDVTETTPITGAETIVGTLQYMSPEQLEGYEADERSDIFGFGATMHEMLTGQPPFSGKSRASLIASVMKEKPRAISEILPAAPPALDRLVRKCLQKDPDKRWQSAKDLKDELEWVASAGSQAGIPKTTAIRRRFRMKLAWVLTVVLALAAGIMGMWILSQKGEDIQTMRFSISLPPDAMSVQWPQISPDGKYLAFRAYDSIGVSRIWIRPINSLISYPLAGTDNAFRPFWSPDSKYLAFFTDKNKILKKVAVAGGQPQVICRAEGADGSWGSENIILFDGDAQEIYQVSASGGIPKPATVIDSETIEQSHSWPSFIPDGKHFIYTALQRSNSEREAIYSIRVGEVDNMESKVIGSSDTRALYCEPGYILYMKSGFLMAHRFDVGKLEFIGEPVPLTDVVSIAGNSSEGINVSASNNGILAAMAGSRSIYSDSTSYLVWVNRKGTVLDTIGKPGIYFNISLSHDETKLAYQILNPNKGYTEIWIRDLRSGGTRELTQNEGIAALPAWSHDDRKVIYIAFQDSLNEYKIFWRNSDGKGEAVPIEYNTDSCMVFVVDWTRGDTLLLFDAPEPFPPQDPDIRMMQLGKPDSVTTLVESPFWDMPRGLTPDGRYLLYWLANGTDNTGYVMDITDRRSWQLFDGGTQYEWRPDGKEIFYLQGYNLMAVPVSYENGFQSGEPKRLFSIRFGNDFFNAYKRYAVTKDGQRFIFAVSANNNEMTKAEFEVVLNWHAELDR